MFFGAGESNEFKEAVFPLFKDNFEDDVVYIRNDEEECAIRHGVQRPGLAYFKPTNEPREVYEGPLESSAVWKWYREVQIPSLFEINKFTLKWIYTDQRLAIVMFLTSDQLGNSYFQEFKSFALKKLHKILFAYAICDDGKNEELMEFNGISKEDYLPQARFIDPVSKTKYAFESSHY